MTMHVISLTFIFRTRSLVILKIGHKELRNMGNIMIDLSFSVYYTYLNELLTVPLPKNDEGQSPEEGSSKRELHVTQARIKLMCTQIVIKYPLL